jgi:methionyl-tRNA formyltransferase
MTPTATKAKAQELGIPVYTPKTLKDESFAELLSELSPDIIVVVAYGKILPKSVLDFPKYGCINLHVSLLPKYRGAAPMQRAIIDGNKKTGVTVMQMDVGLDTGDILTQEEFPIGAEDNFENVHDTSAQIGGRLLSETIDAIEAGSISPKKQDDALATYAAKIEKSDCKIDFSESAAKIDCQIRGVTPIPGAFAYQEDKMLKIYKAEPLERNYGDYGVVKEVDGVGSGSFTVSCGEGSLKVLGVIPEGKGKMTAGDYVRGRKINVGDKLS